MRYRIGLGLVAACLLASVIGCTLQVPTATQAPEFPTAVPSPTKVPDPTATRFLVETPTRTPAPTPAPSQTLSPPVGLRVGDTAPDFALESLQGETLRLSDMRGQVVMINFWAVWCGYCRIELPAMQAVYQVYQDEGFVVLAVDVQESKDVVKAFVEDVGLTFPILLDQRAKVTSMYRIRGLPTSIFVDPNGVIAAVHLGPVNEQIIQEYMAEAGVE